jgi:transcriptional regulator with XRE-family HTH domain
MSRGLDRERVARYVIDRRGGLGLTQEELADRAGLDRKTIYHLESAERWPQVKTRGALEEALGWASGDLIRIAEGGEPSNFTAADAEAATAEASAHDATVTTIERASARLEEISQAVGLDEHPPFPNPTSKTQEAANTLWAAYRLLAQDDTSDASVRMIRRGTVDLEELQEREKLRGSG